MSAQIRQARIAAALVAASLLAAAPQAFAQDVSEFSITARAPTTITISLSGKSHDTVRSDVRSAARTVCRNAVRNDELDGIDLSWCRQTSAAKALRRYSAMVGSRQMVAVVPGSLVLSLR